jgi:hypothetical protein
MYAKDHHQGSNYDDNNCNFFLGELSGSYYAR